jgi:uncharacterized damage-inducible protein DinB
MPSNAVADNFLAFAYKRLQLSQQDIANCLDKLSDEQIWQRGGDYENSVANLLLHLEGNLRQWILHGIDDQPDVRQRLEEACQVIAALPPERLLLVVNPQPGSKWRNATILEAIFLAVGHVQLHTGQIILLTKQLTASDLDLSTPRKR